MRENGNSSRRINPVTSKLLAVVTWVGVMVVVLVSTTGCSSVGLDSFQGSAGGSGTGQAYDLAEVSQALQELEVSKPGSMSDYSRESFKHWSRANDFGWDAPQDSCDAREAALIRDGEDVEVGSGCKVMSGSWYDPYTDQTFTDPSDIDTDHVVPLANAYRSGAASWTDGERELYANDPEVLLSVEDNANQSKGDKGPEAWKPPNEEVWCDYAERWVQIKAKYDLSVNEQERVELEEMLGACGVR